MTEAKADPKKIQQFIDRADQQKLLVTGRGDPEFPPFVFVLEGRRLMTDPNVKAVNRLAELAKASGLWPGLLDGILRLRISRASVKRTARVARYEWTEMAVSADTVSFEEWAESLSYRRSDSSTLVQVAASAG